MIIGEVIHESASKSFGKWLLGWPAMSRHGFCRLVSGVSRCGSGKASARWPSMPARWGCWALLVCSHRSDGDGDGDGHEHRF